MHTHLKGRIFSSHGVSYLVLSDDCEHRDTLRVKALNASRSVREMLREEIEQHLGQVREPRPVSK